MIGRVWSAIKSYVVAALAGALFFFLVSTRGRSKTVVKAETDDANAERQLGYDHAALDFLKARDRELAGTKLWKDVRRRTQKETDDWLRERGLLK